MDEIVSPARSSSRLTGVLAVVLVGLLALSVVGAVVALDDQAPGDGVLRLVAEEPGGQGAVHLARAGDLLDESTPLLRAARMGEIGSFADPPSQGGAAADLGEGRFLIHWEHGQEVVVGILDLEVRRITKLLAADLAADLVIHHDAASQRSIVVEDVGDGSRCWRLDHDRLLPAGRGRACRVLPDGRLATLDDARDESNGEWTVRELDGSRGATFPASSDQAGMPADELQVVAGAAVIAGAPGRLTLFDLDTGEERLEARADQAVHLLDVDHAGGRLLVALDDGEGRLAVRLVGPESRDDVAVGTGAAVDAVVLGDGTVVGVFRDDEERDRAKVLVRAPGDRRAREVIDAEGLELVGVTRGRHAAVVDVRDDVDERTVLVDAAGEVEDVDDPERRVESWFALDGELAVGVTPADSGEASDDDEAAEDEEADDDDGAAKDEERSEETSSTGVVVFDGDAPGAEHIEVGADVLDAHAIEAQGALLTASVPGSEDDDARRLLWVGMDGAERVLDEAPGFERIWVGVDGATHYLTVDGAGGQATGRVAPRGGGSRTTFDGGIELPVIGGTQEAIAGIRPLEGARRLIEAYVDPVLERCVEDDLPILEDGDALSTTLEPDGLEVCIGVPPGGSEVDLRVRAGVDTDLYVEGDDDSWTDDVEDLDPRLEWELDEGYHLVIISSYEAFPDGEVAIELTYAVGSVAPTPPAVDDAPLFGPDEFGGDAFGGDPFGGTPLDDLDGLSGDALEEGLRLGMREGLEAEGLFSDTSIDCIIDGVFEIWSAEELIEQFAEGEMTPEFLDEFMPIFFDCVPAEEWLGTGDGSDPFVAPPLLPDEDSTR